MILHTIGHSTRTEEEFVGLLHSWEINVLIDVRGKWPYSRHNPQHNQDNMREWLAEASVEYLHMPKLGGWQPKQPVDPAVNGGWRHQGMHNYADYTLTPAFEEGVGDLLEMANRDNVAYMCAEAVPWRCHRLLLSNELVSRGYEVRHIMTNTQVIVHELGKWGARPVMDYERLQLVYPKEAQDAEV